MKRFTINTVFACWAGLALCSGVQVDEFRSISKTFLSEIEERGADDPVAKAAAEKLSAKLDAINNGGLVDAGALTSTLRAVYPEFAQALKTAAEDPEAGIEVLGELTASDDGYLAAEAGYYRARLLIGAERFEEALPDLQKLRDGLADKTLRSGESLYYQGVCNANMLQRTAAADNLNGFVENYPDSSPRLIGAAWDLIASLERVHRGSIDDVASHMEFSRRKLGLTDAGDETQQVQGQIILMLDELIAMAEEQEKQQPP